MLTLILSSDTVLLTLLIWVVRSSRIPKPRKPARNPEIDRLLEIE